MLFTPTIGTELSGRLGGIVASHNAGGAYFRAATIPTNPNTPQQQVVRNAVSSLTNAWVETLTVGQRLAWEVYADNVKVTNRIGAQINISGLAMYVRSNVVRVQAGIGSVNDGPTVFDLGSHRAPTLSNFSAATQLGDVGFFTSGLTDLWANEVGGFMFVFLSRPQNQTINFFKGPYRQSGGITGDPVPPVPPIAFIVPFPFAEGNKIFARFVSLRADGRTSTPSFAETIAVA
ncbi:hypothetical protein LCGC14_1517750 [marine sediment metagenome]|uniref:Uncharacterized protein n=1 Tax=marine sediment metagenome TaxID=412755 RepID=A0A0F9IZT0_9ZZZZ